jgi:outer membrane lipoprotein carrier protein
MLLNPTTRLWSVVLTALALAGAVLLAFPLSLAADEEKAQESGEQNQLNEAVVGLSKRYQELGSFSAKYTRTTVAPATDSVFRNQASHTANGVLQWKRMAKLRLDQASPSKELMLTDGETVWWYLPEEKQVHVYRDVDLAGQLAPLLNFMAGLQALDDSYKIVPAPEADRRDGQTALVLESKTQSENAGQLVIYCDSQFTLTGFRLSSLTGEKTDFFLSGIKVNPGFKDEFFVFKAPRGTTIVEETEG